MEECEAAVLKPNTQAHSKHLSFIIGVPTKCKNVWPFHAWKSEIALSLSVQLSCEDLHNAVPSSPTAHRGVVKSFIDTEQFIDTDDKPPRSVVWQNQLYQTEKLTALPCQVCLRSQVRSYLLNNKMADPQFRDGLPRPFWPSSNRGFQRTVFLGRRSAPRKSPFILLPRHDWAMELLASSYWQTTARLAWKTTRS